MLKRIGLATAVFILVAAGLIGLSVEPALAGTPDDTSTVERYYNEHTAQQNTNSTLYVDAVSINFTPPATKDYLVVFSALTNNSSIFFPTILHLDINGTGYSETSHRPVNTTLNWRSFGGQKVITANAGVAQDISIQYKTGNASATAYVQRAAISIIEIANYENAEANAETSTTSSTYENKVTLTFTPSEAADYLVLATINSRNNVPTKDCYVELMIDGVPAAELTTVNSPYASAATAGIMNFSVVEHTLQINYRTESAGTALLKDARITVVKASDLGTLYYAGSPSESYTQSPTYIDKVTLNFTPSARKDYFVIADGLGRQENFRYAFFSNVDIDGTSYGEYIFVPSGRSLYRSFLMLNKVNLSATNHNIKIQYKTNHAGASSEAFIKHANITVLESDTAESYSDSPHTTVSNNFTGPTGTSAYIWSHGLRPSQGYTVAYYDADPTAGGNRIYSQDVTSTVYGNLSSQYLLSSDDSAITGAWHAVVFDSEFGTPADDYDSAVTSTSYVVEDSFNVQISAITDTLPKLAFTTGAQTLTAGQSSGVMTIQTQNAGGSPVNVAANTTINLTSTSGTGRFDTSAAGAFDGSVTSVTIPSGTSSASFYYRDTTAGSPTITANESPSQGWAQATQVQTVNAGAISRIVFTTTAQTLTAGQTSAVMTIQTQDAYGNPANVTGDTIINLTSTSENGRFDTSTAGAFDGSVTSVTITNGTNSANFYYKDTLAGSPTITAAENPSQGWTDAAQQQTVITRAISRIIFTTYAQTLTAGQTSGMITIQTQDDFGNPVNVAGNTTINLTSSSGNGRFDTSGGGAFDGSVTSVTIPSGSNSASFYYKDTTVGTYDITVDENPSQAWAQAHQQQTIIPGYISQITFITSAQTLTAGHVSGSMTIQTQDAYGNPANVTGDTTIDLTSTSGTGRFDTSAGGAFDGSITSVTIPSGTNSASFYYEDTAVGTPTITAAENPSQVWTDAAQQQTVNPATSEYIVFVTAAQTLTAGQTSGVMTIQIQDGFGNPVTVVGNTTIDLTSTSGTGRFDTSAGGAFDGSITSVTITGGTSSASFYYKDTLAGSPIITAAENPSQDWTDATQQQTVNAGAVSKLVFTTPARTVATGQVSLVITVQSQDTFGNISDVAADTIVNLTSSSGNGIFCSDAAGTMEISSVIIFSGANSASFYYEDTLAGSPTITAAENPSQGWTDAAQQQTVNAGAVSKLVFTTPARTVADGQVSLVMTVKSQDAFGNTSNVISDTTINLSSTSGNGIFYSDAAGNNQITSTTLFSGTNSVNLYYGDNTAGSPTITAAESPDQGLTDATQQQTVHVQTPPAPGGYTVGGEVYPINKAALLAPWIALAAAIIAGGVFLIRRRVHS